MPTRSRQRPRISIVTPSYNQAAFIERTIRSVADQSYSDVEHIVVDGMSYDGTAEILARHPQLIVIREPDRGQSDAINKGFALSTGTILAFLNADDTLEPGTLDDVASRLDPESGPQVVMGRCRFVDETDRFIGIEHPSAYENHERILAIWKGHCIPQPAVFWTRRAWLEAGPLDIDEHQVPDYEFFCRLSRIHPFASVDRVYASYRLHALSKTSLMDDDTRLRRSIAVSRRFWGGIGEPMRWRLAFSLARFRLDRIGRARRLLKAARYHAAAGHPVRFAVAGLAGAVMAPDLAFDAVIYPVLRRSLGAQFRLRHSTGGGVVPPPSPQTLAYMHATSAWEDGWVGPRLILEAPISCGGRAVRIRGEADFTDLDPPLHLEVRSSGGIVQSLQIESAGPFEIRVEGSARGAGPLVIEILSSVWFVRADRLRNGDHRPLAWRLLDVGCFPEVAD